MGNQKSLYENETAAFSVLHVNLSNVKKREAMIGKDCVIISDRLFSSLS